MQTVLIRRLEEAGIVKPEELQSADRRMKVRDFCPHHVSHYLGMDVHDSITSSKDLELQPGMVITLEPGIYIPRERDRPPGFRAGVPGVREEFLGVGVRVEDDVLITDSGHEVLTDGCPKTVAAVEEICAGG